MYPHQTNALKYLYDLFLKQTNIFKSSYKVASNFYVYSDKTGSGKSRVALCLLDLIHHTPCEEFKREKNEILGGVTHYHANLSYDVPAAEFEISIVIVPHYLMHQWVLEVQKLELNMNLHVVNSKKQVMVQLENGTYLIKDTVAKDFFSKIPSTFLVRALIIDELQNCRFNLKDLLKHDVFIYKMFALCATPKLLKAHAFNKRSILEVSVKNKNDDVEESLHLQPCIHTQYSCTVSDLHHKILKLVPKKIQTILLTHGSTRYLREHDTIVQEIVSEYDKGIKHHQALLCYVENNANYTREKKDSLQKESSDIIRGLNDKIHQVTSLVKEMSEGECVVCFDSMSEREQYILPCAHVFCVSCIKNLQRPLCPYCRHPFIESNLSPVCREVEVDSITPETRVHKFIRLYCILQALQEKPYKLLLYIGRMCRKRIEKLLEYKQLRYNVLNGGQQAVVKSIKHFKQTEQSILVLHGDDNISGFDLPDTTHVVMMAEACHDKKQQIIGRAQRPNRRCPLNVIELISV